MPFAISWTPPSEPGLDREDEISTLSKGTRVEYIVEWLTSRVRLSNRTLERQSSGELFKRFLDDGVFHDDEVVAVFDRLLPKFADDFITDNPKGFENWAEIVLHGQAVPPWPALALRCWLIMRTRLSVVRNSSACVPSPCES